jgi:hypothetical protein
LSTIARPAPGESLTQSGKSAALVKKQSARIKPKLARATKTIKTPERPARSSRAASSSENLICRYCGSDDLASSFRKRCDARCRACFKERYGSAPRNKKTARNRKTKATK